MPIGLYVHVPFCATLCPYCDFYTKRPAGDEDKRYLDQMRKRIEGLSREQIRADSIYFGGGTPSVLPADGFASLPGAIYSSVEVAHGAEVTVECNPSSDLESFLPAAAAAGVNRVSLGMQSAVDAERRSLGRLSDRNRAEECLKIARENGIENLTLDIMLGVPGQTLQSLAETLEFVVDTGVPHVSAYMLKLEEGTVFYRRADSLNLPEDDVVSAMYLQTIETLEAAGLKQYEISNFARPGFESRHNLKYWHCEEYLGLGPAAHSFYKGRRFYEPADLGGWLDGSATVVEDGPGGSLEERLMLALRLTEGVTPEALQTDTLPAELLQKASQPFLQPYLTVSEDRIALTKEGFLVSNAVIAELL